MRSWLGVGVALVVGIALGALLASARPESRAAPPAHARPGEPFPAGPGGPGGPGRSEPDLLPDLLLEVRTLRSEIVDALRRLEVQGAVEGEPSARVPESGAPPRVPGAPPELLSWMERLDARLGDLAKAPGTLPVIRLPPAGVRPRPLPLPAADDEDGGDFAALHLLWTYQDLLDAYGRPDLVHEGGEWEYRYQREDAGERGLGDVHFQLSGGLVVHAFAH